MLQLIGPQCQSQMLKIPPLKATWRTCRHALPDDMLHIVRPQHHLGIGKTADKRHIGRHEEALKMHHVKRLLLQYGAQPGGESLAAEALDMVRLAAEHGHRRCQRLDGKVHILRLEACLSKVFLAHLGAVGRVFVTLHRQHLDLAAFAQQTLRDAVHGHGATVNGGERRFDAELQYFHFLRLSVTLPFCRQRHSFGRLRKPVPNISELSMILTKALGSMRCRLLFSFTMSARSRVTYIILRSLPW